jgi:transcriptional regulator with XRE-family HTH domain
MVITDHPIIERVKFLQTYLNVSIRKFAQLLDLSESNIRNYTERNIRPSSEFLTKIALAFPQVNLKWLLTGEGEPFQSDTTASSGSEEAHATKESYRLERDSYKAQLALTREQVALLHEQLKMKDEILAAKQETINLLRASHAQS